MGMPAELLLVRHGESEGNIVHRAGKSGNFELETPEYKEKLGSEWRLTDHGIEQAETAGQWIRDEVGTEFRRAYTSRYLRARETAGHLGLGIDHWYISPYLHERNWGIFDEMPQADRDAPEHDRSWHIRKERPLDWQPPGGESLIDMCVRLNAVLSTLSREAENMKAILVCHGEVIEAFRILLERIDESDFVRWSQSNLNFDKVHNGEIIHYSRRSDPENPDSEVAPYLGFRRSVCPWDTTLSKNEWEPITRPRYTDQQLLEGVEYSPRVHS